MKHKIISIFTAVVMLISMIPLSGAANANPFVTETIDLGDGFIAEITSTGMYSQSTMSMSSTISPSKKAQVSQNGKKIGTFNLYAEFTYDGSSSRAIDHDWDATVASGYDYDGNSYISGSSVKGSCTFTGGGFSKTVTLKITCDKNGNVS